MHCPAIHSTVSTPTLYDPLDLNLEMEGAEKALAKAHEATFTFCTQFEGYMEMYGDGETVAAYLNAHEAWFSRCAQPMKVTPMGERGYILTVGRFGSFGYEVEPQLAIVLQPPKEGVYVMHSVPLPHAPLVGYEVDYQAVMDFVEIPLSQAGEDLKQVFRKKSGSLPTAMTRVQWQLQMTVSVEFPKFIERLPQSVVQSTGDRLLSQIVRQVSPRLTYKVQQDFHDRFALPMPPKTSRFLQRVSPGDA
jgi:hypothetical protein